MSNFFNLGLFVTVFVTLIVVLNPIPNVPVFLRLTSLFDKRQQKKTAIKAVFGALMIIVVFSLIGNYILRFLGISIPAIMITGGIILLLIAFQLLLGFNIGPMLDDSPSASAGPKEDVAIVPLAFPLIAGPGSIVTVITQAQNNGDSIANWAGMFAAVVCAMLIVLVFFLGADAVSKYISPGIMDFITKIFGMLLAAVAIGLCGDGIYEFVQSLILNGKP